MWTKHFGSHLLSSLVHWFKGKRYLNRLAQSSNRILIASTFRNQKNSFESLLKSNFDDSQKLWIKINSSKTLLLALLSAGKCGVIQIIRQRFWMTWTLFRWKWKKSPEKARKVINDTQFFLASKDIPIKKKWFFSSLSLQDISTNEVSKKCDRP